MSTHTDAPVLEPESADMSIVGDRIRAAREKKGWSQNELARRSHVSAPTVSRIESGETPFPTQRTVERLARALSVPSPELWGSPPLPRAVQEPAPPTYPAAGRIDIELLTVVLEQLQAWLEQHNLSPTPRRRAEIVALLYDIFAARGVLDQSAFVKFMELVLQK